MLDFYRDNCDNVNGYCKRYGRKPCRSTTNASSFGIIDEISEPEDPAFLQDYRPDEWHITVKRNSQSNYPVTFNAIDKCLEFPQTDNPNIENSRCEGILYFDDRIYFLEIKNDNGSHYTEQAKRQLSRSIHVFSNNHDLSIYHKRIAVIANIEKPRAPEIALTEKEKFFDDNFQFDLIRSTEISIP